MLTSLVIPLIAILALYVNMLVRLWRGSAAMSHGPGPSRDIRNFGKNQENKKRVTRMIIVVIIVFAICWTPLHIVLILNAYDKYPAHNYDSLVIFQIFSQCLAYFNSCLNPLLYAFFSHTFRREFWDLLHQKQSLKGVTEKNATRIVPKVEEAPDLTTNGAAERLLQNNKQITNYTDPGPDAIHLEPRVVIELQPLTAAVNVVSILENIE